MADNLHTAILNLQSEIGTLQRDAINPHFKSKYISLETLVEQVQPLLTKHGLAWNTFPTTLDGSPALRYELTKNLEQIGDTMPLLLDKQNAQGLGSALTYARRYALCAVLNIVADSDDDGNKASEPSKKPAQKEIPTKFSTELKQYGVNRAEVLKFLGDNGVTLDDIMKPPYDNDLGAYLNAQNPKMQNTILAWAKERKAQRGKS